MTNTKKRSAISEIVKMQEQAGRPIIETYHTPLPDGTIDICTVNYSDPEELEQFTCKELLIIREMVESALLNN